MDEKIVTGKKLRRFVNGAWERISFWHKASDCIFDDGDNAQVKLGNIRGITSSTNITETGYAADAKVVSDIYNSFNSFINNNTTEYIYKSSLYDPTYSINHNYDLNTIAYQLSYSGIREFIEIQHTTDYIIHIELKDVYIGDKIFLILDLFHEINGVFQGTPQRQQFRDSEKIYIDVSNNMNYEFKTSYDEKTKILTLKLPGTIFPTTTRANGGSKIIYSSFFGAYTSKEDEDYNTYEIQKIIIMNKDTILRQIEGVVVGECNSGLNIDTTNNEITGRNYKLSTKRFECYDKFDFCINKNISDSTNIFRVNNFELYHNNLSTSSTGSNLVCSDGNFYVKSASSKRYKNSINTLSNCNVELSPEKLYDIDVVSFKYNDDYLLETDQRYQKDIPGFIAEDIYEKYPIACNLDNEGQPEMWDINIMFPAALKLIQDQHQEIEKLKKDVALLKGITNDIQ